MSEGTDVTPPQQSSAKRARWPWLGGGQLLLLIAAVPIAFGSFLPWLETALGSFNAIAGPGLATLAGAMLAVCGALLRRRGLALAHAIAAAGIGVGLPLWQVAHTYGLVGAQGWLPGGGMVLVFVGGLGAALAAHRMRRDTAGPR
ncbi:hypothetical protein ER308_14375 [Egibacter rhizosphaerae]|uniref:SPW repeat-containing protein n=1 Tax=Egibacter rhizosphaerae TaxID=1670831 RepID=A0A411YHD5_9ACTN|nr:hypothetical protein [Egibacter rhizosphaerae]QBI20627.1 hypothetical protein ER308_14375 [Egibacter rhizosphaerae]